MIYTIVGIGQKPKQYYLWSYLIVEEIHPTAEAGRISYQVLGDGWLLASPPFLNSSTFNSFKKSCGNFSAGMVAIRNSPYPNTLQQLAVEQQPQDTTTDFWKLVEHFYAQASSKHPKDAEILCKQGLLKYKRGNDRQAIQLFTQALTLSPNFAQAYYYRGLAYCQLNEIAAAIADLQVAVDRLRDAKPQPPLYQLAQELLLELD
jgi:tetratricopeptide (TPR) repeat protein